MPANPMRNPQSHLSPRRRLMWLLWLVLLLPMVQTAVTLHVLSHAVSDVADGSRPIDGKLAIEHAHCDLCLAGASLIGAAPPSAPPHIPQPTAIHEAPLAVLASALLARTVTAYQSRAPPLSLL